MGSFRQRLNLVSQAERSHIEKKSYVWIKKNNDQFYTNSCFI